MRSVMFKLKDTQGQFQNSRKNINAKRVTPAEQKETLISLVFSYGYSIIKDNKKQNIPLRYSTGEKIKPYQWNNEMHRARQVANFDYNSLNDRLDNIETTIKKIYRENPNSTPEQLKKLLDIELHPEKNNLNKTITLNSFIDKYINDIRTGVKKTSKGTNYKKGTLKAYDSFKQYFTEFQTKTRIQYDFKDINIDFYNSFTVFLNKQNASPNTIGKHIKVLKAILNNAKELKLHNNTEYTSKAFKVIKVRVENIYLSELEIKKIYDLDLTNNKRLDIARDVFLVGCYTAQRFSDYSKINETNIKEYSNIKYIELIQQKTGEKVIIPIRTELNEILKKYDYNLPKTHEQRINKLIKDIGKLAGINESTTTETTKGGLVVKKQVPKYEQITTHTARRSGATNMYLAKIPTIDIMKITGHRSESSFLTYIKVTKQETAESLSMHPYFNNN